MKIYSIESLIHQVRDIELQVIIGSIASVLTAFTGLGSGLLSGTNCILPSFLGVDVSMLDSGSEE